MHMTIGAIVYAEDEEVALEKGRMIFDDLVEKGYFDYFTTADEENIEDFPPVLKADSPKGEKFIKDRWTVTEKKFIEACNKCRWILENLTPEQIMEDKVPEALQKEAESAELFSLVRPWFNKIGAHKGPSVYLYDDDGEGIRSEWHLKGVLEKWRSPQHAKLNIYVVPADVHY